MVNNEIWNSEIHKNFNSSANEYSDYSFVQKHFCYEIISLMKRLSLNNGQWFDLGAGTGFLADLIENQFPNQKVWRIDFSQRMLMNNKKNSNTILWDLNHGLPKEAYGSSLLVSKGFIIEPE